MAEPTSSPPRRRRTSRGLSPRARKTLLMMHVAVSVGWLGGSYAMLILSVVAMRTADPTLRHDVYELMHINDPALMYPCAIGVVGTGLAVSLGTQWGLLRHYWVAAKFMLTLCVMLFGALFVSQKVDEALLLTRSNPGIGLAGTEWEIVLGSAGMILALAGNTVLSIFKPWGRTRRGRRILKSGSSARHAAGAGGRAMARH